MTTHLEDRYGTAAAGRRGLVVVLVASLVVAFGGWLIWATVFHATPAVESEPISFEVMDENTARAVVAVSLEEGVSASCTVRAFAEDHSTVGELAFAPVNGRNEVTVRTEREATSVTLIGCTAPGQPRPR